MIALCLFFLAYQLLLRDYTKPPTIDEDEIEEMLESGELVEGIDEGSILAEIVPGKKKIAYRFGEHGIPWTYGGVAHGTGRRTRIPLPPGREDDYEIFTVQNGDTSHD